MKMSLVVDGLRSDVVASGSSATTRWPRWPSASPTCSAAPCPARILDLLSDVAAELSAELPDGRVEIRVAGDDVDLAYVEDEPGPAPATATATTCRPASPCA